MVAQTGLGITLCVHCLSGFPFTCIHLLNNKWNTVLMVHSLYISQLLQNPLYVTTWKPRRRWYLYTDTRKLLWRVSGFLSCTSWITPLPFFGWTWPPLCCCMSNGVYFMFEYKWTTSRTQWLRSSLPDSNWLAVFASLVVHSSTSFSKQNGRSECCYIITH
jgi:hypothetical protein